MRGGFGKDQGAAEMNPASDSRFIAFFDECGDHSLEKIDADFPLFVLSTVIIERADYVRVIVPELNRLKLGFWPHEGVNLHSRDIRKAHGDFAFMQVPSIREAFLAAMSTMVATLPFTLFITAIQKQSHKHRYGDQAKNPYDLALTYSFERILHFMKAHGVTQLPITAETRGKNEDNELAASFLQIMTNGTRFIRAERFRSLSCPINFRRKAENIAGLQLADLCAHPAARHILNPSQPNHAFNIVKPHLYEGDGVTGWKVFP